MRRLAVALCAAVVLAAALAASGSATGDGYRVAAIFDTAAFVIPGQDVKIAGARVGQVTDVSLTEDRRARIEMELDPRFAPFRSDGDCTIQPQSLIGEKFVQCAPGTPAGKPLPEVRGIPTLPLERTHAPVDLDIVLSTFRDPTPQRVAVFIASFGGGLAARGEDLNASIRRANPALAETNRTLAILDDDRRTLGRLVDESDRVLEVLAARREDVAAFVRETAAVTSVTSASREQLAASVRGLPGLLRAARPALGRLEGLARAGVPALRELKAAAPGTESLLDGLQSFSERTQPAFARLEPALTDAVQTIPVVRPQVRRIADLLASGRPVAGRLDELLTSMRERGAVEGLQSFVYYAAAALARFDRTSHILPAYLLGTTCSTYATVTDPACDSHFAAGGRSPSERRSRSRRPDAPQKARRREQTQAQAPEAGAPTPESSGQPPLLPNLTDLLPEVQGDVQDVIDSLPPVLDLEAPKIDDELLEYLLG